jgi:hypothetical protein
MELTDRLAALEDEINVLKTEVKTVLVDIRDQLMKPKSPFAAPAVVSSEAATIAAPWDAGVTAPLDDPELRVVKMPPAGQAPAEAAAFPAAPAQAPADDLVTRLSRLQQTQPGRLTAAPNVPGAPREWGVLDIASMGKWAEAATRRVGRKRLEDLLGVYSLLTGEPQDAAREALLRMLDLCGADHEPQNVSMNDVVSVLSQLDALFRSNSITEVTVLSLLSDVA